MRRRWPLLVLAMFLLLVLGIAVGRQTTGPAAQPPVTVTVTAPESGDAGPESEEPPTSQASGWARTPEGAVAAARAYLTALAGPAIVDPGSLRTTLTAIASASSRDTLVRAYELAASQTREQLGIESGSDLSLLLRTASVGYRIDGFHPDVATVSIWRLGIVGSGTTIAPRQSWRTETVSLVWEDGAWKLDALRSSPGPTPPLSGPGATPPAELAAAIPTFESFTDEHP
ncbi:MAG TPA: hypothetical protein VFL61_08985 [Gaiellaceae bacterium]|nr:hypothetical protein [Gaiellaceae bacterium]